MKKLCLIGAVLLVAAAPVWARVDIACTADGNIVTVSYRVVGDPNKVRAFALDIMVNSPAVINDVTNPDPNYWVYPGSIVIVNGEVNNVGTPVGNPYDPCLPGQTLPGLDSNGVTIEMGSLYYPTYDSSPNSPAGVKASGLWYQPSSTRWDPLLQFKVNKRLTSAPFTKVTIRENAVRGGVVLTNGSHPDVNVPTNWPMDCLIGGNAGTSEYTDWVKWGYPKCWCYSRQCRGDAEGKKIGYLVFGGDLAIFKTAYSKTDPVLAGIANGICADLDHKKVGYRVFGGDLTILKTYYSKPDASVPTCEKAPIITGPYNWWAAP